ncbi:hypothetical protein D3C71_1932720 [compost metagenome]
MSSVMDVRVKLAFFPIAISQPRDSSFDEAARRSSPIRKRAGRCRMPVFSIQRLPGTTRPSGNSSTSESLRSTMPTTPERSCMRRTVEPAALTQFPTDM